MKPCFSTPWKLHWSGWTAFCGVARFAVGRFKATRAPKAHHARLFMAAAAPDMACCSAPRDPRASLALGRPRLHTTCGWDRSLSSALLQSTACQSGLLHQPTHAGYSGPRPFGWHCLLRTEEPHVGSAARGQHLLEHKPRRESLVRRPRGARLNLYPARACGRAILFSRRGDRRIGLHP